MKESNNIITFKKNYEPSKKIELIHKVRIDRIALLYEQIPIGIIGLFLVSLLTIASLWQVTPHLTVFVWGLYMLIILSIWMSLALCFKYKPRLFSSNISYILFALCVFLTACGWGYMDSIIIPPNFSVHQTFIIIILVGMTASANTFFFPFIEIYALFLLPAFVPFNIWLFLQGGLYSLLGICGIVYMFVLFGSCFYANKFLISSLALRYKNIDLDTLNQFLERRVEERTNNLEQSLAIIKSTLESTADGILVVDNHGNIEFYNQKVLKMWNLNVDFMSLRNAKSYIKEILKTLKNPNQFSERIDELSENLTKESYDELYFKDGKVFEWYSKPHKVKDIIVGRVWSFSDITIRKQMEQQLSYQANHDLLTGLPNRTLLYDRINQGINYANRFHNYLTMLFLDIDNFKIINDNLGHESGDILLKEVAARLKDCVRDSDTVARFGGDEFVILFITNQLEDTIKLSEKVLEKIVQPIQLISHEIVVTTSIGLSIYPKDGDDAATLLKNADVAMYLAKSQGRNNYKLYDDAINQNSKRVLELQIELRSAIENKEFFLLYQPIIDLKTGQITAVEVLVRWLHPNKKIIAPLEFISVAEESGIIVQLGESICRQACFQIKEWQNKGLPPIRITINISGVQIKRDNFTQMIVKSLNDAKLDPHYLELELTESIVMSDSKNVFESLELLSSLGVNITIDDFGTGYSSLNYLKQFPVNRLKIDRSLVENCTTDQNDASIIEAIIAMGHGLKLTVIAEGIETTKQLKFLIHSGCDEGQGYLYSKPLDVLTFEELLKRNSSFPDNSQTG